MRKLLVASTLLVLATPARDASADITAFLGATTTPTNRQVRGFAIGLSLIVVGVEFEYADTSEDTVTAAPALRTGMGNLFVQTPSLGTGFQVYGTVGGGLYREQLGNAQETNVGANAGAGVKVSLFGPVRARVDYRVFKLKGTPLHDQVQRIYAGLNVAF